MHINSKWRLIEAIEVNEGDQGLNCEGCGWDFLSNYCTIPNLCRNFVPIGNGMVFALNHTFLVR